MKNTNTLRLAGITAAVITLLAVGDAALGQTTTMTGAGNSPWVRVVNELSQQISGPIARGLCVIAITVGGLMFAFGEPGSKRTLAGIIFGVGMAMAAVQFLDWLFPTVTP